MACAKNRSEFNDLILGDRDCLTSDVVAAIQNSASFARLHVEWSSLARHLEIQEHIICKLTDEFVSQLRIKTLPQLVCELLTIWKAEKGDQAKIVDLCDALTKCGLTDIAQSLSTRFGMVSSRLDEKFIWQGNLVTLTELIGKAKVQDETESRKVPELQGREIIKPHLVPPTQPKYYIPRTLLYIPSHELDSAIFLSESTREHIFLLNEITKPEVAKLTRYKYPIELSGDQLYGVTARFVILECVEDYDRICKHTSKPVHLIQHKEPKRYFWVKSNAALDKIAKFLKEPPKDISEEDLVDKIISNPPPCLLSIADSPGMGKTFSLANLATKIQGQSSSRTIHLFIVLQEFAQQFFVLESVTSALKAIATYSSMDQLTEGVVMEMLKYYQVYLFLDGYDEVIQDKLTFVDSFLKYVQELPNFKVIVTSRSHLKSRLEIVCNQFSFEIHPFNELNQIEFLTRYWAEQHGSKYCSQLEQYSHLCLSSLKTSMSDKEGEIAGIPLQCMMIGEVYAEDAKRACKLKTVRPDSVKPIAFIQMYQKQVDLKFSRIPKKSCRQNYVHAHVHEAIKLLFPGRTHVFNTILRGYDDIDETTVYSIGLVERGPTTNRFIHRTFAEYLLAEFIVDNLEKQLECVKLLFDEIIGRNGTKEEREDEAEVVDEDAIERFEECERELACAENQTGTGLGSFRFTHYELKYPVICYFIDKHMEQKLSSLENDDFKLSDHLNPPLIDIEDVCVAILACSTNELEYTFTYATNLLLHHKGVKKELRDRYFKELPHSVVQRCNNKTMLEKVLAFTKKKFGVGLSYHVREKIEAADFYWITSAKTTPLHVAAREGNYNLVTWLVKKYGNQVDKLQYLLHASVTGSALNSDAVLEEKRLIIDMLVGINGKWIAERDNLDCTPFLHKDVHLKLLQHLVQHGADVNACSKDFGTVLHQTTISNSAMYTELARWAFSNGFNLVKQRDFAERTPLMHAIEECGVAGMDDEILNKFMEAGSDLHAVDENGDSVLFYAIHSSGNFEFIRKLIELGADLRHKNNKNQNAVHMVMLQEEVANEQSIEDILNLLDMLVEINPGWINEKDDEGCTPMLVPRDLQVDGSHLKIVQRLVKHGADINAYSDIHGTVLHAKYDKSSYKELVRWAFSNGFNLINHKDQHNRTPLIHARNQFWSPDEELLQLFREAFKAKLATK